jgi:hypothetical protein
LLGKGKPFDEEFPQIADLRVEIIPYSGEPGEPLGESRRKYTFTINNKPDEYFDCDNLLCYGGGFSIREILRDMVKKGEAKREQHVFCRGWESSPKGRDKHFTCSRSWTVRVSVVYKAT